MTPDTVALVHGMTLREVTQFWSEYEAASVRRQKSKAPAVRDLCQHDLFYLLVRACKREDMLHPWIYERCREVEAAPDGHLDLWAREHYKSTIITFGLTIQSILRDPEVTIGIFSHTRPIAKAFLRQIMRELEGNVILNGAFPDVLWGGKLKDAPKWSEDEGIIVKRKSNPNEATVEAWGVVDGQPTSKHFKILLYDDVVVRDSVTNPEMMEKTMAQLEMSYNLGQVGGARRFVGTRWHFNDAYRTLMNRGSAKLRFHPGRKGGEEDGESVYWPDSVHLEKRRDMGPYSYASQILLNPKADALQGFRREWLRYYKRIEESKWKRMSRYLIVDPANSKKKGSDYTSMGVVALGFDRKRYLLDGIRDRLNLTERTERLFDLHRKWEIRLPVRYEKYGMQADIEHIKSKQEDENYRFDIVEVGGQTKKEDRIGRLIPIFEQGDFLLPEHLYKTDYQKTVVDLVHTFIEEEYAAFPVGLHDDFLDMLARMEEPDLRLVWPKETKEKVEAEPVYRSAGQASHAWMG